MILNEITGVDKKKIKQALSKYSINNYSIRDNGLVDVNENVILTFKMFKQFPVKFGVIKGSFDCSACEELETLEGGPIEVHGYFDCNDCSNLVTLEGAPEYVGGGFSCLSCENLKSLVGIPKTVKNKINARNCFNLRVVLPVLKTKQLKGIVIRDVLVQNILNKYLPTGDILGAQNELLEAGFEEYARIK